jgi:hypothetical protein
MSVYDNLPPSQRTRYWIQSSSYRDGYTFYADNQSFAMPGGATNLGYSALGWHLQLPTSGSYEWTRTSVTKAIASHSIEIVWALAGGGNPLACQLYYGTVADNTKTSPKSLTFTQPTDGNTYVQFLDFSSQVAFSGTLSSLWLDITMPVGQPAADVYLKRISLVSDRTYFFDPPPLSKGPLRKALATSISGINRVSATATINWDWADTKQPQVDRLMNTYALVGSSQCWISSKREASFGTGLPTWTRYSVQTMQRPIIEPLPNTHDKVAVTFTKAIEDLT